MNLEMLKLVRSLSESELAEVALLLAAESPVVFANYTNAVKGHAVAPSTPRGDVEMTQQDLRYLVSRDDLSVLEGMHDKVRAVKYLREACSLSLREAKDLTEWLARNGHVNKPHWYETFEESKERAWREYYKDKKAAGTLTGDDSVSLGDLLKAQLASVK